MAMRMVVSSLLLLALVGCNTFKEAQRGEVEFAPSYPEMPDTVKYSKNGGIYHPQTAMTLFETPRARHVGDLLTVLLVERTQAQKRAESSASKEESSSITNPTLLGSPLSVGLGGRSYNLGISTEAEREFDGRSRSRQDNQLSGNISVTVAKVLANGNMVVKGEKWIHINQGKEYIRLSGIVRPQDIQPDNTVTSDKVANAYIAYSGTGQEHDANKRGWLSRFLWSSLFPF